MNMLKSLPFLKEQCGWIRQNKSGNPRPIWKTIMFSMDSDFKAKQPQPICALWLGALPLTSSMSSNSLERTPRLMCGIHFVYSKFCEGSECWLQTEASMAVASIVGG